MAILIGIVQSNAGSLEIGWRGIVRGKQITLMPYPQIAFPLQPFHPFRHRVNVAPTLGLGLRHHFLANLLANFPFHHFRDVRHPHHTSGGFRLGGGLGGLLTLDLGLCDQCLGDLIGQDAFLHQRIENRQCGGAKRQYQRFDAGLIHIVVFISNRKMRLHGIADPPTHRDTTRSFTGCGMSSGKGSRRVIA